MRGESGVGKTTLVARLLAAAALEGTAVARVRFYELEQEIPASAVHTFTGPQATLIFCNTAGFHRGGFSTTNPRVLATVTYSSPASLASLTERSYQFTGRLDELDAPVRFALS